MKTLLLFISLLFVQNIQEEKHIIEDVIPESTSLNYNEQNYNEDKNKWTETNQTGKKTILVETKHSLAFLNMEHKEYVWCSKHREFLLIAVFDQFRGKWYYNPKLSKYYR